MKKENTETLFKKLDGIEKMMWEDRKFLIDMMQKVDKIVKFVNDITVMEDIMLSTDIKQVEEEKILKSIMEDLRNDIDDKRDEFIKYHQMINSDQVGES
jgi:uncharacterized protein with HEPN domain